MNFNQVSITNYENQFPFPADGTIVESLPSALFWSFKLSGILQTVPTTPVVQVNDLSIASLPHDAAPSFSSGTSTSFVAGVHEVFDISTMGVPLATLSEVGSLPNGVTFVDNGNGSAVLSGTPAPGTAGTYPITITATNGIAPDATQTFTLTVVALGITTSYLPRATIGSTYSGTLTASGGTTPYKWKLAAGSSPLPSGLRLKSTGIVTGKPKVLGSFSFTVNVVDKKTKAKPATQNSATAVVTIVVTKPPDINGDGVVNCADLAILTSQYGQTGTSLSADLDGDGAVTLRDFSILASSWSSGQPTTC